MGATVANDFVGRLASGCTVRVTQYAVEALDPDGVQVKLIATGNIAVISRLAATVDIQQTSGETVGLTMLSVDDAAQFETVLRDIYTRTMPQRPEVLVKTYDKEQHYVADAPRQSADGWQIVSTNTFQPRSGWARILFTLGWMAVVYPPKPQIVVTYQRAKF